MLTRLILLFALLPFPALAGVCNKERPDWSPALGAASGLDELVFLFTSLPGLGLLGALTLAALSAQKRYFAITAVFATLIGTALSLPPDDLTRTAITEGCVGPQTLSITVCAVIALIALVFLALLWLRERPATRI